MRSFMQSIAYGIFMAMVVVAVLLAFPFLLTAKFFIGKSGYVTPERTARAKAMIVDLLAKVDTDASNPDQTNNE